MTRLTKTLLAGTAGLALFAAPAMVAAEGTGSIGSDGSIGVEGSTTGATGTMGTTGNAAAGTAGAPGAAGSAETTGSIGGAGSDPTALLEQRGYTDIEPKDRDAGVGADGHMTYKARNSAGDRVELVVDTTTGDVVRETPKGTKAN